MLKFLDRMGSWPFCDCLYLGDFNLYAFVTDVTAEEGCMGGMKPTFFCFDRVVGEVRGQSLHVLRV